MNKNNEMYYYRHCCYTNVNQRISELFSKLNIREGTYLKIYIFAN